MTTAIPEMMRPMPCAKTHPEANQNWRKELAFIVKQYSFSIKPSDNPEEWSYECIWHPPVYARNQEPFCFAKSDGISLEDCVKEAKASIENCIRHHAI